MILVAIGSNLPNEEQDLRTPLAVCEAAVSALRGLPGVALEAVSRWYASAPVPRSDQPDYVNGVARLRGDMPPEALLSALQGIEQALGRQRSVPNAARTLDLDIIAQGTLLRVSPDPILPHPRATGRAFVLLPLRDVAPDWVDPATGEPVEVLLARLPAEDRAGTAVIASAA